MYTVYHKTSKIIKTKLICLVGQIIIYLRLNYKTTQIQFLWFCYGSLCMYVVSSNEGSNFKTHTGFSILNTLKTQNIKLNFNYIYGKWLLFFTSPVKFNQVELRGFIIEQTICFTAVSNWWCLDPPGIHGPILEFYKS